VTERDEELFSPAAARAFSSRAASLAARDDIPRRRRGYLRRIRRQAAGAVFPREKPLFSIVRGRRSIMAPTSTERSIDMTEEKQTAIEAAVFRRLLQHLDSRTDVQNIELMNLAGFCRNCLAKWYVAAATEVGEAVDYDAARERVYGMPYEEWKTLHQKEATPAQLAEFGRGEERK
jgi:uncharacterized protein